MWVNHPTSNNPLRYHLNCRGIEIGVHDYDASVILVAQDRISLHLPPIVAKSDKIMILPNLSLLNLNLTKYDLELFSEE